MTEPFSHLFECSPAWPQIAVMFWWWPLNENGIFSVVRRRTDDPPSPAGLIFSLLSASGQIRWPLICAQAWANFSSGKWENIWNRTLFLKIPQIHSGIVFLNYPPKACDILERKHGFWSKTCPNFKRCYESKKNVINCVTTLHYQLTW